MRRSCRVVFYLNYFQVFLIIIIAHVHIISFVMTRKLFAIIPHISIFSSNIFGKTRTDYIYINNICVLLFVLIYRYACW